MGISQHCIKMQDLSDSKNALEALEAKSLNVPFQCRNGFCGFCRARLIKGIVKVTQEPLACVTGNEVLLCSCIPVTDVKFEFDEVIK